MMGRCVIVGGANINNYDFIREKLSADGGKTQECDSCDALRRCSYGILRFFETA